MNVKREIVHRRSVENVDNLVDKSENIGDKNVDNSIVP